MLTSGAIYFLLMGLNHWETRYYFFMMVIYAGLAVHATARLLELGRARGLLRHGAYTLIPVSLVLVMWSTSLAYSWKDVARFHPFGTYATETDFYHLFAPDASRLADWRFPENPYQGPGYPAALAVVTKLTGDLFISGKWISITSAALVALLTFWLCSRLFGYWTGVGAATIVMVSGEYLRFTINATTDVFFLLLCLTTLAVFTSRWLPVPWRVALAAVAASLTYLTRYNGLFLLAACLFGIVVLDLFGRRLTERLGLAAVFVGVFLLTA
ncbi:MAG: hypothetical protein DMG07_08785 [Acidobacteria bacterium]|nr:MAG: hypothetical protein DMG07_08785 [Acidobacteriota bacterium]